MTVTVATPVSLKVWTLSWYFPRVLEESLSSYTQFQRSNDPAPFDDYKLDDGMIAWIDILGVRSATHSQIISAVRTALDLAAECSATGPIINGTLIGTPQSALQFSLVGDALVLVEKHLPNTPAASKLALVWRICELSSKLFQNDLVHRGAVTFGPVECFKSEGVHVITGKGVVRAVALESSIKCTGLFFDEKCVPILEQRQRQLSRQAKVIFKKQLPKCFWFFSAPNLAGVLLASQEGNESWMRALNQAKPHKYIRRSKALLKHIEKAHSVG